ncbi:unnamed protein product [Musa textilis]
MHLSGNRIVYSRLICAFFVGNFPESGDRHKEGDAPLPIRRIAREGIGAGRLKGSECRLKLFLIERSKDKVSFFPKQTGRKKWGAADMGDTRGGKNDSFISFLPSMRQAKKTGGGGEVEPRRPASFCRPDLTGSQHPRIVSLLLSFVRWRPACLDGGRKQQSLCRHGTVTRGS